MAGKPFRRGGKAEWYCIVEGTPDPVTGQRKQRWLHAPTRKAVLELQTKALRERDTGTAIDPSAQTVGALVREYFATVGKQRLRGTVLRQQEHHARLYLYPHLDAVPVQQLTPQHIAAWHAALGARLAPATIAVAHSVLNKVLHQAVRWQVVGRNVCALVPPPRPTSRAFAVWDRAQIMRFLAVLGDAPRDVFYGTALETGLRRSELAALRWSDLDLSRGTLTVVRAFVVTRGNRYATNETKSASSRRRVPLLPQTVVRLAAHRARQEAVVARRGATWDEGALVFAGPDGAAIKPTALYYHWGMLIRRAGLPYIRPHDARHTHATLLLALNVHPRIVQERLGHSDASMTMRVYSHVLAGMQEEAIRVMAHALDTTTHHRCAHPVCKS